MLARLSKPVIGKWTSIVVGGAIAAASAQGSGSESFSSPMGYPGALKSRELKKANSFNPISSETDPAKIKALLESAIAMREFQERMDGIKEARDAALDQQKSWVAFVLRERERERLMGVA